VPVFLVVHDCTNDATFESNASIKLKGAALGRSFYAVAVTQQSMIDRLSPPVFHSYLR
jgi:hypothetical protein